MLSRSLRGSHQLYEEHPEQQSLVKFTVGVCLFWVFKSKQQTLRFHVIVVGWCFNGRKLIKTNHYDFPSVDPKPIVRCILLLNIMCWLNQLICGQRQYLTWLHVLPGQDLQLQSASKTPGYKETVLLPNTLTLWSASQQTSCRPISGNERSSETTSAQKLICPSHNSRDRTYLEAESDVWNLTCYL